MIQSHGFECKWQDNKLAKERTAISVGLHSTESISNKEYLEFFNRITAGSKNHKQEENWIRYAKGGDRCDFPSSKLSRNTSISLSTPTRGFANALITLQFHLDGLVGGGVLCVALRLIGATHSKTNCTDVWSWRGFLKELAKRSNWLLTITLPNPFSGVPSIHHLFSVGHEIITEELVSLIALFLTCTKPSLNSSLWGDRPGKYFLLTLLRALYIQNPANFPIFREFQTPDRVIRWLGFISDFSRYY